MERIYRLANENIIMVKNNLEITAELVNANRAACRKLMEDMEGSVVLIIDYREAKMTFAEIMKIVKGNQAGNRADLNQKTFTIMVGTDQLVNLYRDTMLQEKSGAVQVPYFSDMDKALEAARIYLQDEENAN